MMTEKHIISRDGTKIGYRQAGAGPGLIIVHGSGRISQNYGQLANTLVPDFTVYVYDRRGRGLSGPVTGNHNISKEIEDLHALACSTGASYIFGHSFGGLVALQSLLQTAAAPGPAIKKVAAYDPGVSVNGSIPVSWLPAFEKELLNGNRIKAMGLLLKGLQTPMLKDLPAWVLRLFVYMLRFLERKKDPAAQMLNLLHTLPPDIKILHEAEPAFESYRTITIPVLLLSGSNSQPFFRQSVQLLSQAIKGSQLEVINGFDHYSPEEKVNEIADRLRNFFLKK